MHTCLQPDAWQQLPVNQPNSKSAMCAPLAPTCAAPAAGSAPPAAAAGAAQQPPAGCCATRHHLPAPKRAGPLHAAAAAAPGLTPQHRLRCLMARQAHPVLSRCHPPPAALLLRAVQMADGQLPRPLMLPPHQAAAAVQRVAAAAPLAPAATAASRKSLLGRKAEILLLALGSTKQESLGLCQASCPRLPATQPAVSSARRLPQRTWQRAERA